MWENVTVGVSPVQCWFGNITMSHVRTGLVKLSVHTTERIKHTSLTDITAFIQLLFLPVIWSTNSLFPLSLSSFSHSSHVWKYALLCPCRHAQWKLLNQTAIHKVKGMIHPIHSLFTFTFTLLIYFCLFTFRCFAIDSSSPHSLSLYE